MNTQTDGEGSFRVTQLLDMADQVVSRIIRGGSEEASPEWYAEVLYGLVLPELRSTLRGAGLDVEFHGPYSAPREWIPAGVPLVREPGAGQAPTVGLDVPAPAMSVLMRLLANPAGISTGKAGEALKQATGTGSKTQAHRYLQALVVAGVARLDGGGRGARFRLAADAQAKAMTVGAGRNTALYRWYDAAGRLLYVGIADNLISRTKGHAKGSSWMEFAASSTVERFPSRWAALDAEEAAIKAEQPLFNDTHNRTPEARQRLVGYLIEHGRADLLAPVVSRG